MENIRPQLAADIDDGKKVEAKELSPEQLQALADITRLQLLEDIAHGMSVPDESEDERF